MLSFIFAIISLILIFVLNNFLGAILAIIALIISIVNFKKKKVINYVGFGLSLALVIYSCVSFVISSITVNSTIDEARKRTSEETSRQKKQEESPTDEDTETINGVLEYKVPDNYYINESGLDIAVIYSSKYGDNCYFELESSDTSNTTNEEYLKDYKTVYDNITYKDIILNNYKYGYIELNDTSKLDYKYFNKYFFIKDKTLYEIRFSMNDLNNCKDGRDSLLSSLKVKE